MPRQETYVEADPAWFRFVPPPKCPVCDRQGSCEECCCSSPDHWHPRMTECGLCHHTTNPRRWVRGA